MGQKQPTTKNELSPWAEIGQQCLAVRMRVLSRAVTAIYDEIVRQHGVTVPQVNLLACTASFGETRPGRISEALHMDHTTTSRNVERLVKAGWLEYVPDHDGRARPFRVSRRGQRLLKKILPDWRIAQRKAHQFLGDSAAGAVHHRVAQLWASAPETGS